MNRVHVWAVLGLALAFPTLAADIYVSPSGTQIAPFATPASAATSIQAAVDAAHDGDTVLVGKGTYVLSSQISVSNSIAVQAIDSVAETIVDGNNSNRCFYVSGANVVLRGLTIQNGRAAGESGGAILARQPITVQSSVICSNSADFGAGVEARKGLTMSDTRVEGNSARVDGGGVSASGVSTVSNCTFTANSAGRNGGGIDTSYKSELELVGCTISGNSANSATASHGGGVHVTGTATVTLRDSIVAGNHSAYRGADLYNAGTVKSIESTISKKSSSHLGVLTVPDL